MRALLSSVCGLRGDAMRMFVRPARQTGAGIRARGATGAGAAARPAGVRRRVWAARGDARCSGCSRLPTQV